MCSDLVKLLIVCGNFLTIDLEIGNILNLPFSNIEVILKFVYGIAPSLNDPSMISNVVARWQARREYDRNMRAGLIPSRALQERRIVHERNERNGDGDGNIQFLEKTNLFNDRSIRIGTFAICNLVKEVAVGR